MSSDKSARPGSCQECKRSKLKCDRVFPCQACIRRGAAHLCPNGVLTATKGNKVLMVHSQRLSEQVKSLTARVQELEAALAAQHSTKPTKSEIDCLYEKGLVEGMGSLALSSDGQALYHGSSAGSGYFKEFLPPACEEDDQPERPSQLNLPFELVELSNAFPLGLRNYPYDKSLFIPYLPSHERATHLVDLYYKNIAWMYNPVVREDFVTTVLDPLYNTPDFANLESIHSDHLSIFFVVLAEGVLFDPHPTARTASDQYHVLARAAFSLIPISDEATTTTVQALFMLIRLLYNIDRKWNEERWLLLGICGKLALRVGLHRDSAGRLLDTEELQRRRRLFHEFYTYESWSSIACGRPPSLLIQHSDCHFPIDLDPLIKPSGESESGFHAYKFRYSASCLSISIQHIFFIKNLTYEASLDLDKKIRLFPIPQHLRSPVESSEAGRSWSKDPEKAMQQYCIVCERESNLLYLHRGYFAKAIREAPCDPLQHKYGPSVLATYRSACRLISSLKGVYVHHPEITSRTWFFWSAIFSSCIMLAALVVESPGCTLAKNALQELEAALSFYDEGSRPCRPSNTLTTLQTLCTRAQTAFAADQTGARNLHPITDDPSNPDVLDGRKSVSKPAPQLSSRSTPEIQDALMDFQQGYSVDHQQPVAEHSDWCSTVQYFESFPEVSYSGSSLSALPALAPPAVAHSYGAFAMEPSQDAIWRNFMREFGLES